MTASPDAPPSATRTRLRMRRARLVAGDATLDGQGSGVTERRRTLTEVLATPSIVNLTITLLFGALAAAGAVVYTLDRPPTYQSRATVLIDHPDVASVPNVAPIIRLNALRSTYAALVTTEQIAVPVAERLRIDPAVVLTNVDVVVPPDSLIMYTTAQAGGRVEAQVLAHRVTEELVDYVAREQAGAGIRAADRVRLVVVDNPRPGFQIAPTGADAAAAAALAGAVGIGVSYVVVQVATSRRAVRRRRRRQ